MQTILEKRMIGLLIFDDIVELLNPECNFAFPATVDELIANNGPVTIKFLADICKRIQKSKAELFLLDAAEQSKKLFELFCHEAPPLNPKLRTISHFYVGQEIMAIGGYNHDNNIFCEVSTGNIISIQNKQVVKVIYSATDHFGRNVKKSRSLYCPCLMTMDEYLFLLSYPQFIPAFFKERNGGGYTDKYRQTVIERQNPESMKKTIEQVDQKRGLTNTGKLDTYQDLVSQPGLFFTNGLTRISNNYFVPCHMFEYRDERVMIRLDKSHSMGAQEILTQSRPCKRFISLLDAKDFASNKELFTQWLMAFTHRPSSMKIEKDYTKSTNYINEIVMTCDDIADSSYNVSEAVFAKYRDRAFNSMAETLGL